jgi:PAS domain S-box-containing protein
VLHKVSVTGEPVLIPEITKDSFAGVVRNARHAKLVREMGQCSVMVVPLTSRGAILGALSLSTVEPGRKYDGSDLAMAEELGRRCGAAVDNARVYTRLADSERRLALTLRVSGVGFFDRGHPLPNSLYCSDRLAQIFGFTREELPPPDRIEKWFLTRVHPEDLPRVLQAPKVIKPGRPQTYTIELRALHKKGHWVWVRAINHIQEWDESRRVTRATGVILDITDLKEAERTLKEYSQELEARVSERTFELERLTRRLRLLASELTSAEQRERRRLGQLIHDDLQQLLVAAKLQVNSFLARDGEREGHQSLSFAASLLDKAIEESRSLTYQLRPPALHETGLVSSLHWLAEWMKQAHGLKIDMDLDKSADLLTEHQALILFDSARELLLNVVKYAGVDTASVSVRKTDGWLRMSVADKGKGFDVTTLDSLRGDGTGFGLFSIRERLLVMGGRFEARSAPGQGTVVELMWPSTESAQDAGAATQSYELRPGIRSHSGNAEAAPGGSGKITVLLVDDHAVVRQGIASVLDNEPDMVVIAEAADGQEAVEAVGLYRPQVVVMDVNLPRLNGVQASRIISERHPEIRLIGLSIHNDRGVRQAMLDAGASDYLHKDGPVEALIETIRRQSGTRPSLSGV